MSKQWSLVGEGLTGAVVIFGSLLSPFLRHYRITWGATETEIERTLPGDDIVPHPKWQYTNAITIDAPVTHVWPWLVQIGQGRGGWYSYEWLENLIGCKIHNADRIIPQFQTLQVGDSVRLSADMPGYPVVSVEIDRAIVLYTDSRTGPTPFPTGKKPGDYFASSWVFFLDEADDNMTRLITRLRSDYNPRLLHKVMFGPTLQEPLSTAMQRKMLQGIRKRAEVNSREK
jgi:hypothetical protein